MVSTLKKTDLLIAGATAILYIFFSFKAFPLLEGLERIIYSVEMRLDLPGTSGENKIAIVNIDEKSLNQLGSWPWPRNLIADMIKILKENGARLIGLDIIFQQKEQNRGLIEIKKLKESVDQRSDNEKQNYLWLIERLAGIYKKLDNDTELLGSVEKAGNVILPVRGKFGEYQTELVTSDNSLLNDNSIKSGKLKKEIQKKISVNELITPFAELAKYSRGLGHNNLSPNENIAGQVHLPFIDYRGNIIPSTALRMALDFTGNFPRKVTILEDEIMVDDKTIPTSDGQTLVKFKGAKRSYPYYSFVDILSVKKVPAVFEDKIVLIGLTAKDIGEFVNTPVDPEMPQVELTANIIEDFIMGRYLKRPASMVYVEALIILLLSTFSGLLLPRLNYFPRSATVAGTLFILFLTSVVLFISMNIWFKIVYISLSIITIYVVISAKDFAVREKSLLLSSKESVETNRMLGLSFQSQGLLDLAFEKFRKCPLDDSMKDVLYNLGLDFERKRMLNKAISVYEYISKEESGFRDLEIRIPRLRKLAGDLPLGKHKDKKELRIAFSDDLETKPTVGRYEILGELGQGAMGIVYKGRDPKINRLVAIKTIRFSDDFDEKRIVEVKERFFREAEMAGKLSHPSIISIYDVGEDYDLTYMTMELLNGKDLEPFCQKGHLLSLRKVLYIIAETAEALDYAHTQEVIHRDIKPGNIMYLENGRIKVTDFGIAKAVSSSQTKSGIILGTPNYMSPEQINGKDIDGRSDIFSLGIVFFQLLTGQLPFGGRTLTELFYQITQAKHASPREINPKVIKPCEQLIDKALMKDPEQRFQRARDFAKYLRLLIGKIDKLKGKEQQ